MAERKLFDIVKRVPIAGFGYGAIRGATFALAGDADEAKYSWEMDVADLNPLRMPRNMINGIINSQYDLAEGIWIGKRSLSDQPFSLTFVPGSDVYHWCIQIDGIIYELGGSKQRVEISIISEHNNPTKYKSHCKRFSWTKLEPGRSSSVSDETLRDYAKAFEKYTYLAVLPSGNKINCQTFVSDMFAKAAGMTQIKARGAILALIPNILF
ncbi:unnamed protein product [Adineta steineri]|uniref:Uncharacterized protein n=3 Tax=Adineta steineri TaxID=433720 RepID=A0A815HSM8_9BILA|nr:unnamed protein product [Adineta steineri]CAF3959156.1 unnamed protein product [Adineta steineri]